jgi:transforming growth factor-beta-induced protein
MNMKSVINKVLSTIAIHSKKLMIMVIVVLVTTSSCTDDFTSPAIPSGDTIVEIAEGSDDFDILVAALTKTGLNEVLDNNNAGKFTVFAPNDAAFLTYLQAVFSASTPPTNEAEAFAKIETLTNSSSPLSIATLVGVLNYHIISSEIPSSQITGAQVFTTLNGARLSVSVQASQVLINANINATTVVSGALVTDTDLDASNGFIHVIDRVLVPISSATTNNARLNALTFLGITGVNYGTNPITITGGTTSDVTSTNFNLLAAAIRRTGLATALQPNKSPLPDFTIFAPTDGAMIAYLGVADEAAGLAAINALDATALASLANVLQYHVVSGRVLSTDLTDEQVVTTLLTGTTFAIDINGSVYTIKDKRDADALNDPTISSPNILTNAGVVHAVNTVFRSVAD